MTVNHWVIGSNPIAENREYSIMVVLWIVSPTVKVHFLVFSPKSHMVQWLRYSVFTREVPGSIPGMRNITYNITNYVYLLD
jgi:hypothetical protein